MSELTALSTSYSAARLATDYSMSVVKKVMDTHPGSTPCLPRRLSGGRCNGRKGAF